MENKRQVIKITQLQSKVKTSSKFEEGQENMEKIKVYIYVCVYVCVCVWLSAWYKYCSTVCVLSPYNKTL